MANETSVKEFYKIFEFDRMIKNPPKQIQDFLNGEIKFINEHIKPSSSILEIGCGYGRLLNILAENAKEVTGIDFSEFEIDEAKKFIKKDNIKLELMNAKELDFPNDSFDYVVCLDATFGNMPKIESEVIKEMSRVCKRGGEIIISVFSEEAKEVQIENYERLGMHPTNKGNAIHTIEGFYSKRFSKRELKKLFSEVGLNCEIQKISSVNYIVHAIKN